MGLFTFVCTDSHNFFPYDTRLGQNYCTSHVSENALEASMKGSKFKIKSFKIYTDKDSGDTVVHAIAKGNGKKIAVLLEFAEKTGEISL